MRQLNVKYEISQDSRIRIAQSILTDLVHTVFTSHRHREPGYIRLCIIGLLSCNPFRLPTRIVWVALLILSLSICPFFAYAQSNEAETLDEQSANTPDSVPEKIHMRAPFVRPLSMERQLNHLTEQLLKAKERMSWLEQQIESLNVIGTMVQDLVVGVENLDAWSNQIESRLSEFDRRQHDLKSSIMLRAYEFKHRTGHTKTRYADYDTRVSATLYPIAFVSYWSYEAECVSMGPLNPSIFKSLTTSTWHIKAKAFASSCRFLDMLVVFSKQSELFGNVTWFQMQRRTKGGVLERLQK